MRPVHSCGAPVDHERLVAYWANDLKADEIAAIDEQIFSCDGCAHDAQRVSTVVEAFRSMLPPVISREQLDALRAEGRVIRDNEFEPGVRKTAVFERDVDLLIHHLRGLELADAERVSVVVRSEGSGAIFEELFAPFDRERGEVLIACQRHFASFPPDVAIDVRVYRSGAVAAAVAEPTVATYLIPHDWR